MITKISALPAHVSNYALDLTEVNASVCRDHFFHFIQEFWDVVVPEKAVWNFHIEYLADELQEAAERVFRDEVREYDLIINVPPGSTKSTICSVMYPAWIWTRMASARIIGGSHGADLALKLAVKARDIIQSEKYQDSFPDVRLRHDQSAKGYYKNHAGGDRFSVGAGSSVIGMHGHFLLIDDPVDPETARKLSQKEMEEINKWCTETLPSRKVDKQVAFTCMIQQRLHQNDQTGYRLKLGDAAGPLKHICLPAEVTEHIQPPELKEKYQNGLLDPIRLPRVVLKEIQSLSDYAYAGQYLQHPVPLGGGMFEVDKFKIGTPPQRFKRIAWYIDKAATDGSGAYSVLVKMAEDFEEIGFGKYKHGRFWVLKLYRGQWGVHERETKFREYIDADLPSDNKLINQRYLKIVRIGIEQEPGSGGKESAQNTIRTLAGYKVIAERPTGDKSDRAEPFATQVGAGNVYLAKADWNHEYIEELRYFPLSTFKDQVDASSGAFRMLFNPKRKVGGMPRK